MKRTNYLLNKKLIVYLLPSVLMAFAGRLGGILDGILAGNMINTMALAAISVCAPVLLCTMLIAWWIANGCAVRIGIYLGNDKTEDASRTISVSLMAGIILSVIIAIVISAVAHPLSCLLTNSGEIQPIVEKYLRISMIGLPTETIYGLFVCCLGVDNYPSLGMGMVILAQSALVLGDFLVLKFTDWGVPGLAVSNQLGYLLSLVILLLVASVYLSISGKAATAGLDAYRLNLDRLDLERQIADRKAQIAILTSSPAMEKRALEMGFVRIDPEDAVYINIPGYGGRQSQISAPPPWIDNSGIQISNPSYSQSLWDWLFTGVNLLSESMTGGSD